MPFTPFNTIDDLIAYIDNVIKENHNEEITGPLHNRAENGIVQYVKEATLNYFKASVISSGGNVALSRNVSVIITTTPTTLTWGDNFSNEWVIANMTGNPIPLLGSLVYYLPTGAAIDNIPANSVVTIFKAINDLWIGWNLTGSGSGGGSVQKQPLTFIVGTTPGAPVNGTSTWTLPAFENSYVTLVIARSIFVDMTDAGDGSAYITKLLPSDTLTITNYVFTTGDILSYTLITP